MTPFLSTSRRSRRDFSRRGMALVISLFFLMLLTVLVTSLLSRANLDQQISGGTVGQARADLLARSAGDIILGELREEIANPANSYVYSADGSDVTANPDAGIPPLVFEPKTGRNMLPAKAGSPANDWPALLKRSYATSGGDAALYPGGRALAAFGASAAASKPSIEGRWVDDTLWRLPALLSAGTTAIDNNWCIVTRSGVQSVSDPDISQLRDFAGDNYAIGRFSYVIYDTGGALDLNVAGHPAAVTGAALASLQGTLAGADLPTAGFSPAQVNDLMQFRNPVSGASESAFVDGSRQATGLGYLQALKGDNVFLNRQDLIRFAKAKGFSALLPSLTHFTRELSAPSCEPAGNAADLGGTGYPYRDNRNLPGSQNPFVANVRMPGAPNSDSYTVSSYKNDGTRFNYALNAGEPLVQRRFPLGRLQWLARNGPANGGTAESIQACFGLKWNAASPADPRWDYVGPTGSTVQTSIKTLQQVAAEPVKREPNFFELLQAGILQGSLGEVPTNNPVLAATGVYASPSTATAAQRAAWQVFQIGANLIDQQNANSYPTRLFFNGLELYGTKNIPYISKFLLGAYCPLGSTGGVPRGLIKVYLEFEMWNPYQGPILADQPGSFRIRLGGPLGSSISGTARASIKVSPLVGSVLNLDTAPGAQGNWIAVASPTLSQSTQDPQILDNLRQQGAVATGDVPDALYANADGSGASYTGLYCGAALLNNGDVVQAIKFHFAGTPSFILEVNDNGNWVPVQRLNTAGDFTSYSLNCTSVNLQTANRRYNVFLGTDPRTPRFGMSFAAITATPYNRTPASSTSAVIAGSIDTFSTLGSFFLPINSINGVHFYRYADNQGNGATVQAACYLDPDGVQRRGDATWSSVNPMLPYASGQNQRPVILNRPFQTVAEMGYAFRDLPFRSVDFFSAKSADAALLDLFTVGDASPIRAGAINLNSASSGTENVQALLVGAAKDQQGNTLSVSDARAAAIGMKSYIGANPLSSLAGLPSALASLGASPFDAMLIKGEREAVLRGIGAAGQARTWNLLIDIIAQSGRYPSEAATLDKFSVEGERRYWLHVAIDRFTGKIVSQQLEPVTN